MAPTESRRTFLKTALASGLGAIAGTGRAQQTSAAPPNIVFFIMDDMHRFMFNCLPEGAGKNLTPNIDRLAREGTVLLGQHVASPVCTPSRYNCLTGRLASRALQHQAQNGGQTVVTWNAHIGARDQTLPKILQQHGYRTGFVGKNHVITAPGYRKPGWLDDPRDPDVKALLKQNDERVRNAIRAAGFDYAERVYHNNPDGNGIKALAVHNLDWITEGALEFLADTHARPFFLYFASTVPHGPGAPDRSWKADRRLTPVGILDAPCQILPPAEAIVRRLKAAGQPTQWGKQNVTWLDDAVGAVMAALRDSGRDDNTVVIFFNDHGQAAKGTLYQGGVSNPSIVWRKGGFPCGSTSNALISNTDFAPTILDLAGIPIPQDAFDGVSALPALAGDTAGSDRTLYFEMGYTRAVRKGPWKYLALRYPDAVRNMPLSKRKEILERVNANLRRRGRPVGTEDPTAPFSHVSAVPGGGDAERGSTGKYPGYYDADQLYDLDGDPKEHRNLAADPAHAGKLAEMKGELQRFLDDLPGTFAELKPRA